MRVVVDLTSASGAHRRGPEVAVRSVDTIERHVETGKTRRFIPLSA